MLFSATTPPWIKEISAKFMSDPLMIDAVGRNQQRTATTVQHKAMMVPDNDQVRMGLLEDVITVGATAGSQAASLAAEVNRGYSEHNISATIEVDDDGDPVTTATRHVFVDEVTCIGCTSCATIAPLTFLMEDDYGRARSFNQEGDDDDTVAEAIATCPVDCIHYVPWDELVKLEREREGVMTTYNFKGRLVGNEGLTSTQGAGRALLDISTNHAMRCQNCPTNQCPDCPMFAVSTERRKTRCGNCPSNGCANCPIASKYPEFQKKRARRERKRWELCMNQIVAARFYRVHPTHCLICSQAGN